MASINLRGDRWQVRVRRKGHATETRSFATKQDAERWARLLEVAMDRGSHIRPSDADNFSLGGLVERYL